MNGQADDWQERLRRIQTCTEPADRPKAEAAVTKLYEIDGLAPPRFQWTNSPLAVISRTSPHRPMRRPDVWPPAIVLRRIAPASYAGVPPDMGTEPRGQAAGLRLRKAVFEMRSRVKAQFRRSTMDRVTRVIESALSDWRYQNTGERYPLFTLWFHGQHDAFIHSFCAWRAETGGPGLSERDEFLLKAWSELSESCGWGLPFDRVCYLCERPALMSSNPLGLLHCDGSPAVLFRDGCAAWALNGVAVPQWLAESLAAEINPRRVVQISNAEVRREFVRKVGMERICAALRARSIDRQGDYELLLLDLGAGQLRPYLKMLNPSIGTWHVEGVAPTCRTVAAALEWRNGTNAAPAALT